MKKIPLNQGKYALVSDGDYDRVIAYKWYLHTAGYAISQEHSKGKYKTRYMHRFIMDAPKGLEIDHKNGNKLDNRRSNLRLCNRKENLAWYYSRPKKLRLKHGKRGPGGYTLERSKCAGAYWDKSIKRWKSEIVYKGQRHRLGNYKTREEAANAYQTWVKQNI